VTAWGDLHRMAAVRQLDYARELGAFCHAFLSPVSQGLPGGRKETSLGRNMRRQAPGSLPVWPPTDMRRVLTPLVLRHPLAPLIRD
jgi:hypothetical protein